MQEGHGKGLLPGGTTSLGSAAELPVLAADAEWPNQEAVIAARVAESMVALTLRDAGIPVSCHLGGLEGVVPMRAAAVGWGGSA